MWRHNRAPPLERLLSRGFTPGHFRSPVGAQEVSHQSETFG